jgi:3',5'-cyclic AMP phosphodiesterase CpdA
MKRLIASTLTIIALLASGAVEEGFSQNHTTSVSSEPLRVTLPLKKDSVRFAIIGDTGSGSAKQQEVADMMIRYRQSFAFDFVLMLGDNLYGGESPKDYRKKFEDVYKKLLDEKIKFYATLGNHDTSNQRFYDDFNMKGNEYYRFKKGDVAFYSLNSNYMDKRQVKWLEEELSKDVSKWKICFLHHPPYSSGKKHGPDVELREVVEPIFLKYGVNLVLAGHEHFYERMKPQKGIHYIISGAGGKLRAGGVRASQITEKSFDQDLHFILVEIADDELHFQVISRTGKVIDSSVLMNQQKKSIRASN